MSPSGRTFLIDGSNTVHALFGPFLGRGEADGREEDLLRLVSQWIAQQPESEAEVVFDGGWRRIEGQGSRARALFAENGSADALILERVQALRYARRKVSVITQDRALADAAAAQEARIVGPEKFKGWLGGDAWGG